MFSGIVIVVSFVLLGGDWEIWAVIYLSRMGDQCEEIIMSIDTVIRMLMVAVITKYVSPTIEATMLPSRLQSRGLYNCHLLPAKVLILMLRH
mmetsp:Transcript_62719/g.152694  ORF Transcript_62719/g.152694 Transcript_62719/m.152694 type:complete len:92 (+) Transcript_62719:98-373(+)